MVRTRVAGIMLASALSCGLVACSAEADPQATLPATTPTTPSPTTPSASEPTTEPKDPAEPELPAAAREPGASGARAFVRHYIQLLNYAGATGDVASFLAAASGCQSCRELASNFKTTYRKGGYYRTDGWRVEALVVMAEGSKNYVALAQIKETPIVWRETAQSPIRRLDAGRLHLRFVLSWSQGAWLVREFTRS